ncbi:MAG: ABC transporter ATP-binding protein [Nitrospirae bacterium]|nr:ABC transporter ATP-binding protein [Candidatus Troglogloeales bacterium]
MSETVLSVKELRTYFYTDEGVVRAVDHISFDIRRGEIFSLVGESGCGKSMTALSLLRLVPPPGKIVSGKVILNGADLSLLPEKAMRQNRGRKIAMIFQEPMTALNPVMTIGNQIAEVILHHFSETKKGAYRRALALLDQVGMPDPDHRYFEYPHQMSGGMKQRVMIAMALAGEPDLLIADEPTTALDVTIQAQILDLLRTLQKARGMAVLLITHDLGVVSETADKVAVMYAGQIVEMADRASFFENPLHPYSKKLFDSLPYKSKRGSQLTMIRGAVPSLASPFPGCRFANRCDWAWEICEPTPPKWIKAEDREEAGVLCHLYDTEPAINSFSPTGPIWDDGEGSAEKQYDMAKDAVNPSLPLAVAAPLLQVSALTVHFPIHRGLFRSATSFVKAVDGVSFEIKAGETVALVGESGCGKTTAGKAILQLITPTRGLVSFCGVDLGAISKQALRKMRNEFQMVFQDPYASLNPRMTIEAILSEGLWVQKTNRAEIPDKIDQLLEQVGLPIDAKGRYPHEFSGGQRQRISIARALSVKPKLIICDEPTSALDVSVQAQILNLLKNLQEHLGLGFLFITHNLSIVEYFADEVAVMYLGRIIEYGKVDEVLETPLHPYTQALLSAVPKIDPKTNKESVHLEGDIPSPIAPPSGCHFHPRCPKALPICKERYPGTTQKGASHRVLCHLYTPGENIPLNPPLFRGHLPTPS